MKEFWSGNLFLILLLRAQQNEFNQAVLCIRTGGVYNVHQSRVIILSGCQPCRLCSQISLVLNIVSKETSVLFFTLYNLSLHSISC